MFKYNERPIYLNQALPESSYSKNNNIPLFLRNLGGKKIKIKKTALKKKKTNFKHHVLLSHCTKATDLWQMNKS